MTTFTTRKQFNNALAGTRNQSARYETLARFSIEQMAGNGNNKDFLALALAAMTNKAGTALLADGKRFLSYVQAHYPAIRSTKTERPVKTSRGTFCPVKLHFAKDLPREVAMNPDGNEYDASENPAVVTDWKAWTPASKESKTEPKLTAKAIMKLAERAANGIGKDSMDDITEAMESLRLAVAMAMVNDDKSSDKAGSVQDGTSGTINSAAADSPAVNVAALQSAVKSGSIVQRKRA